MKRFKDLLDLKFVFTQNQLLSTTSFERECNRRGLSLLSLGSGHLSVLHKTGVLVPMYRVQKDIRGIRAEAKGQDYPVDWALRHPVSNSHIDLLHDRENGFLFDPRDEAYRTWRKYERKVDGDYIRTSEFLYSPYQLLLLPKIGNIVSQIKVRHTSSNHFRDHLRLSDWQRDRVLDTSQANDQLVTVLSALDRIYRPRVMKAVSHYQGWDDFENSFDPIAMLQWLEWDGERVLATAENLLFLAHGFDPLDDWIELIRLVRPPKWGRLKGVALQAMDYRIAAEYLLLFYEDLVERGAASPLEALPRFSSHPRKDRLSRTRDDLDPVLMDYGLSPFPSLVMLLEGETEMMIVPRVMKLLGIPVRRSFIDLHLKDLDVNKLVAHIAPPMFGERSDQYVDFERPPTKFLVVHDAENQYTEAKGIQAERQRWIGKLDTAVYENFGYRILPDDLSWFIEIMTWETGNIEFAHFTNEELALAIDRTCHRLNYLPTRVLREDEVEQRRLSTQSKNITKLWSTGAIGRPASKMTKLEVWEELWLILERKIRVAMVDNTLEAIPIARVLIHAYQLAASVRRYDVVIRRTNEEPLESV